jgi:chemotaxis protein histidine kinase CheA
LEWEISHDKLKKTREEVGTLRESLKQRKDIASILGFMGSVLDQMIADEEAIHPESIKFLLDAKDTIKLSFEREGEKEFEIYRQLAIEGIEARFRGLGGTKKAFAAPPSTSAVEPASEKISAEKTPAEWKKMEELLAHWNHFIEKAENLLRRIDLRFSELEKRNDAPLSRSGKETLTSMDITVFKSYGKLYGVESQKIMKLYKVPPSFEERYGDQPKVRVKDKDVTLIDLKKTFPEESWLPAETSRLLMVQEGEEFKGLIVEEVLKRIISSLSDRGENGKPLLGLIHWNYQTHPVDVPILDVKRL